MGIRTEDPQGMLHVDAKGDTYISVSDTVNISDDVVVTPEGRIGVGTLQPQARLHIVSSTPGAIRIADGTEGGGKILTSDADGRAHWTGVVGSWYAALKEGRCEEIAGGSWPDFKYTSYEESSPGSVNLAAGSIETPYTAIYRITVTGKGHTNRSTSIFLVHPMVYADNTSILASHQHSLKEFGALNFGFMAYVSLSANQKVTMAPHTSYGNLYTDVILHIELIKQL